MHIVEAQQFSREWLEKIFFPEAERMRVVFDERGSTELMGKRMISLFYEPSTRTRASFEMAMDYLGGRVVFCTENAKQFSSAKKGETLVDTVKVLNRYRPDVIVLRCNYEGGAKEAAEVSKVPIINAGDGPGQHPTQALLDIFTIWSEIGGLDGISVTMVGDLKNGRTVRSLCYLLSKFDEVTFNFVSPPEARMRDDIKSYLGKKDIIFEEWGDLKSHVGESWLDVIYQTRAQDERGTSIDISNFIIDQEILDLLGKGTRIMHPLPKREEIAPEVDDDPRAVYLTKQVENGIITRMALLKLLLC